MKLLVLILFCTFGFQSDSIKVDTVRIEQAKSIQKIFDESDSKIDSIIAILDSLKSKK